MISYTGPTAMEPIHNTFPLPVAKSIPPCGGVSQSLSHDHRAGTALFLGDETERDRPCFFPTHGRLLRAGGVQRHSPQRFPVLAAQTRLLGDPMKFRDPRVLLPAPRRDNSSTWLSLAGAALLLACFVAAAAVLG